MYHIVLTSINHVLIDINWIFHMYIHINTHELVLARILVEEKWFEAESACTSKTHEWA